MDADIRQDLELIRESVLRAVPAEATYLFGSYAYGSPDADSDIDIYAVVPDGTTGLYDIYADVRGLIRQKKKRIELDLLMGHASDFNKRRNGPTLERAIARKGVALYG